MSKNDDLFFPHTPAIKLPLLVQQPFHALEKICLL